MPVFKINIYLKNIISIWGIVFIFVFVSENSFAQKNITLDNIFEGKLYPNRLSNIQWLPETSSVVYSEKNSIYSQKDSSSKFEIISLEDIQKIYGIEINRIPQFTFLQTDVIRLYTPSKWYDINLTQKKIINTKLIPGNYRGFNENSEGNSIFLQGKNSIIDYNNKKTTIKPIGNYYNSDSIYRNEFGYNNGSFWSPTEKNCVLILKDDSKVPDYYSLEYSGTNPTLIPHKYTFAGKEYEKIKILTISPINEKKQEIKLLNPTGFYTNPSWNKTEDKLYLFYLNREQDSSALEEYNIKTGKYIRTIFSETHNKYIEPLYPLYFTKNDNSFFYISRKDGYNHIYEYSLLNNTSKQITKGKWEVDDILAVLNNGELLFTANSEKDIRDKHIYKTDKDSYIQLSNEKGWHNAIYNKSKNLVLDQYTSTFTSTIYKVYNLNNNNHYLIKETENPLSEFNLPTIEYGTLIADDKKTELYYSIIKPFDFDSTKQYPVILDVYGGPHYQNITNNWLNGYDIRPFYLAANGYIIFSLDNRGSSNRGMEFESATYLSLGDIESKDQKLGIDFLHTKEYIDTTKIGVMGWSYGGFMSLTLANKYSNKIHACFAGSPVIDWNYYEVMYGERYMNTPQENIEGYKKTSLLENINKDLCPTLLVTGGNDIVTVPTQSIQFIEKCNRYNINIEQQNYPTQGHHIKGAYAYHLYNKILTFFNTNLDYNN